MDEFEDIILDEEDFGVESLREQAKNSHRNNNDSQNNMKKDVIDLLNHEESHIKPINNINNKNIEENEKEESEEYNDFEYNIEENDDIEMNSPKKKNNNNQKIPFLMEENNNNLLGYSSNSNNDKAENNLIMLTETEKNNIINNNNTEKNSNNQEQEEEYIHNDNENEYEENMINEDKKKESIIKNENENDNENDNENENMDENINENENEHINENEENGNDNENEKENEIIQNSSSLVEKIEDNYYLMKNELENILSKVEFNSVKEVSVQNEKLGDYISKLNTVINAIIKIFPKGEQLLAEKIIKNKRFDKEKETKEEREKKIVGIYRREYLNLENKYQLINDPLYKESLLLKLNNLEKEYEQLVEENNILREEQKKNEISIERKTRNITKEKNEVKRMEMDIGNIKSQINLLQKKVNKNKIAIIENNKRINQYVEREKNLDYIAKEKYGIKEYEDIHINEENKIKMNEDKNNLLRKIEIYEKGIETNKNKYEREIRINEKIINGLENEKRNLIYHYKELIGEEKFQSIIENFKKENNIEIENNKEKNKKENKKMKNELNDSNKDNKEDILELKDNRKEVENKNNEKKYPEFLNFFKDEEANDINSNNEIKEEDIKEENNKNNEKEINVIKFDKINSISNKDNEDESPPNEYEDLEEFQI